MLHLQVLEQLREDISNTGSVFVAATEGRVETRGAQLVKKNVQHNVISNVFSNSSPGKYFQQRINGMTYTDFFFFFKFCPLIVK